ncbi:MAG TPA: group III truncated hemoglobin [Chitinophagaceae bacterium]|nr:group III truncated hemoglobin [Chitinophagaceae bacterium]
MKPDIRTREDIALLVNTFYDKVKRSEVIGKIFTEVANIDWEHHMPIMYDFWESILFHRGPYNRNPMIVHKNLHGRHPLLPEHFKEWLRLFKETVDELYEGDNATTIKQRAESIATIIQLKISQEPIQPK